MKKEKFHIEYIFDKVSQRSLWNHLTTPPGLSAWFADDVTIDDSLYTFKWNKVEERAQVVSMKPEVSVRYRWEDEEDESAYFQSIADEYHELHPNVTIKIDTAGDDAMKEKLRVIHTSTPQP